MSAFLKPPWMEILVSGTRPWCGSPLDNSRQGTLLGSAASTRCVCSWACAGLASPSWLRTQCRAPCKHRDAPRHRSRLCTSRLLQAELPDCAESHAGPQNPRYRPSAKPLCPVPASADALNRSRRNTAGGIQAYACYKVGAGSWHQRQLHNKQFDISAAWKHQQVSLGSGASVLNN